MMKMINKWDKRILESSEAHLWVYFDKGGVLPTRAMEVLDMSEKKRFDQYISADKQREFLIGRLFTKHVLAQYIELFPTRIKIYLDHLKKPFLADESFYFNLSHSHGAYVCLVGSQPLGVDVESLSRELPSEHFYNVFTEEEIVKLDSLKPTEKSDYILRLWTMKEAFWKASDQQRTLDFNQFGVSLDPITIREKLPKTKHKAYHLSFEDKWDDYLIAMAIEENSDEPVRLKTFHFEPPIQNSLFTYP